MFALGLALLISIQDPSPVRDLYVKTEVMVPMRDGARLFTAIYAPKDESRAWPILLCRTPYGCAPYGPDKVRTSLGPMAAFTREKYIFVYQDVRGRYMSEGTHIYSPPIIPTKGTRDADESTDAYDTIEWLVKSVPFNNGKVGIWGISQPGYYASLALVDSHPALVCASPQAPVTDRFVGDDDHHNGAFFLAQRFGFMSGFGASRATANGEDGPATSYKRFQFNTGGDIYRYFLELGPLSGAQKVFKGENRFWNWTMEHETYDEFWRSRGVPQHMRNVKPAVLVIGGWFDAEDLWGALNTYGAIERQNPGASNFLLMGPWSHGGWNGPGERLGAMEFGGPTGPKAAEIQLAFFNHYLKGEGSNTWPEATMFVTGSNQWRSFNVWPPRDVKRVEWHFKPSTLQALNASTPPRPNASRAFDEFISDPAKPVPYIGRTVGSWSGAYMNDDQRFAARRPDVLTYQTEPLTEDMTLAGPITADLWVSTTGKDSDWILKVIDVWPDDAPQNTKTTPPTDLAGYQMMIRFEVMRGKFRNSLSDPEPFVAGKPTRVKFTLNDVLHTFKKGHRLMVQVQCSMFPLIDRNPQTFVNIPKAKPEDFKRATQRVYLNGEHQSRLVSGVLP